MIQINKTLAIDPAELRWQAIRASGPGGQNVNKVATAVQLFFDARNSPSLPEGVRHRILNTPGPNLTADGTLIIKADTKRTQAANRDEALRRLKGLIRAATLVPKKRKATRPTRASAKRRVETKKKRGDIKANRARVDSD